jgi:hypothetical protein
MGCCGWFEISFDQTPGFTMPVTAIVPIAAPATGHAEFCAGQAVGAEGAQHGVHFATQMGAHADPAFAEIAQERLGKRGTKQNIHLEFHHAAGQRVRTEQPEQHFPSPHFRSPPQRDDQQSRRCIKQRRNAILPDGKSYSHICTLGRRRASVATRRSSRRAEAQFNR